MDPKRLEKLQLIQDWVDAKPTKDSDWAEDVKLESLHVKFDYQLEEMLDSHSSKVLRVEKDLDIFSKWPDVKRYELTQQFEQMFKDQGNPDAIEGKTLQQWIDEEFESQQLYYAWKVGKLNQSVERIAKEVELRVKGYLEVIEVPKDDVKRKADTPEGLAIRAKGSTTRVPFGTQYYIDPVNGNDGNDGLGTGAGNAWLDLDQFTENARSAGDICTIRRGANQCDDGTDLAFTSDGTIANPIIIEADYDNAWSDRVDLSATGTATLTFGSKTVTFSADVSGVLAAGDWIYANDDNNREFAYEVASVVTTTVTLYLPYKGDQAGSGKTMYNMQDNPLWNATTGDFQWIPNGDDYWKVQGLHIRGTDSVGNVNVNNAKLWTFKDCTFEGNGTTVPGLQTASPLALTYLYKSRFFNHSGANINTAANSSSEIFIYDCLLDGNSVASGDGINSGSPGSIFHIYETEFKNHAGADIDPAQMPGFIEARNVILSSATKVDASVSGSFEIPVSIEDYGGTVGDNRVFTFFGSAVGTPLFQSETTIVRSGGSNKSIKVTPSTNIGSTWESSRVRIFELPIYATTDSKTYTVYFRPSATGDWSADPTASQLWIELEAWGHASNNFRKITKSTGTIDMNGSTSWQSLTVTVAPAQTGVAYLRCWYAKTKEAGSNIFYVDPIPVIS